MSDRVSAGAAEAAALHGRLGELLPEVRRAVALLEDRFARGGTLYAVGNGGSGADAAHLTGELIGHFALDRRPLPAVTLGADHVVASAIANDYDFADVFARQVAALARPEDVVAAFTTSGRSSNVVNALAAARANGAATVLFGAGSGGPAALLSDVALLVPSESTPRVQEVHTVLLHLISDELDRWAAA